jgi:hypothetical protein
LAAKIDTLPESDILIYDVKSLYLILSILSDKGVKELKEFNRLNVMTSPPPAKPDLFIKLRLLILFELMIFI